MSLDQNQAAQIALTNLTTALKQLENSNALAIARNAALAEILQAFAKPKSVFKSGNVFSDLVGKYPTPPGNANVVYTGILLCDTVGVLDISDASEIVISFSGSNSNTNYNFPLMFFSLSSIAPNVNAVLQNTNEFFAATPFTSPIFTKSVTGSTASVQASWTIPCAGNKSLHFMGTFLNYNTGIKADIFTNYALKIPLMQFTYALIK
jgi:hypothetical protein